MSKAKNNNSSNEQLSGTDQVCGKTELNNLAAISNSADDEPIMVVLTGDNLVHWAGQPKKPTAAEWREWSQPGYQVITMTIKQFRQASFKWIYDKKQTNEQ